MEGLLSESESKLGGIAKPQVTNHQASRPSPHAPLTNTSFTRCSHCRTTEGGRRALGRKRTDSITRGF